MRSTTPASPGAHTHPLLRGWYILVEEAEIDLAQNKHLPGRGWQKSFPEKKETPKAQTGVQRPQRCSTACFKSRKEEHQATKCRSNLQAQKTTLQLTKKSIKLLPWVCGTALEGMEVIEFTPSPRDGKKTLIRGPGESGTDSDNDPLVSGPISSVTVPTELIVQSLEHKISLMALLDSECNRCLVNLVLMEELEMRLRPLKVLVVFFQLDGSIAGGIPAMFVIKPVEMWLGAHT